MNLFEVNGTYGHLEPQDATILVSQTNDGLSWYCVEGSVNVNATYDEISQGVHVETLKDVDTFTWPNGVKTLSELEKAVNY